MVQLSVHLESAIRGLQGVAVAKGPGLCGQGTSDDKTPTGTCAGAPADTLSVRTEPACRPGRQGRQSLLSLQFTDVDRALPEQHLCGPGQRILSQLSVQNSSNQCLLCGRAQGTEGTLEAGSENSSRSRLPGLPTTRAPLSSGSKPRIWWAGSPHLHLWYLQKFCPGSKTT